MEAWIKLMILVGVDVGLQWLCFPIAFALKTERFFDLVGSLTHLTITWLALILFNAVHVRGLVQCACVTLWCVRLGAYLMYRAWKFGDARFHEIKSSCVRFFVTWTMQAVWVAANLAPTIAMLTVAGQRGQWLQWRDYTGWSVFVVGLLTETVADIQKLRFKAKEENRGKFIRSGLWAISRHPNYLGEILLWWGLCLAASSAFNSWWFLLTLLGPLVNTLLILFVSGLPMLEKSGLQKWGDDPEYQEYVRKVGVLLPFIPCPLCKCCKP